MRSPAVIPRSSIRSDRGGFALLITLTLLAFLVILLIGLATYTRIEGAIAGNSQRQAQARQNALLALNVALNQLQKHAGPDQRVTATAESFGGIDGTRHYTGVWSAETTGPAAQTWLVSGNENDPLAITPDTLPSASRELLGVKTSGVARDVVAPAVELRAPGVPGQTAPVTVGRYAWWVGDQGVKAPVAVADRTNEMAYPPYDSAELRRRIRQQMGVGAGSALFEPRAAANTALVKNISTPSQLAYARKADGTEVGEIEVRQNYSAWSPNNFAVLANTKLGGLRQDLSLNPSVLGDAFAAWANYPSGMEDFKAPPADRAPAISPEYGPDSAAPDPLRRRYRIRPPVTADSAGVTPVLSYFYLLFGVQKQTESAPYTLSVRWAAALWNPYTSALVPEDLRLEISGLPTEIHFINAATQVIDATASLRQLYGEPLRVMLPWTTTALPVPDQQSWLPGRTYNWVFLEDAPLVVGGDNPGRFNSRDLRGFADGLAVSVPGTSAINGSTSLVLRVPNPTTLTLRLVRPSDGATLATYTTPEFDSVPTTAPFPASNSRSQLGFLVRLQESFDSLATPDEWLTTPDRDPRNPTLPSQSFVSVPHGPDPAAYANFVTISAPERFLDRDITRGTSYNEDVPLFELPRAPHLSLGELQHFYLKSARPFSIGNAWGATALVNNFPANSLFDRFYFSGITGTAPEVNGAAQLPQPLLVTLPRKADGTTVAAADLSTAGVSAKFVLQSGAFDVNSAYSVAWRAVLESTRFTTPFAYLNADADTGTGSDENPELRVPATAHLFRFAQSAHEVFKADDNYAQSTSNSTLAGPVTNTPLFRRGMRALDATQVTAVAEAIVGAVRVHHGASGPFRSLEEFLNPSPALNNQSVLAKAIEDAALNAAVPEFSSQFLTQGDIMTALAPVLFPRSDTFVIRSYGEAVNPTTGATEGRAWCEATVQRVPDYFDPSQPAETSPADLNPANQSYGRRFKVVSFRWLTRSDI